MADRNPGVDSKPSRDPVYPSRKSSKDRKRKQKEEEVIEKKRIIVSSNFEGGLFSRLRPTPGRRAQQALQNQLANLSSSNSALPSRIGSSGRSRKSGSGSHTVTSEASQDPSVREHLTHCKAAEKKDCSSTVVKDQPTSSSGRQHLSMEQQPGTSKQLKVEETRKKTTSSRQSRYSLRSCDKEEANANASNSNANNGNGNSISLKDVTLTPSTQDLSSSPGTSCIDNCSSSSSSTNGLSAPGITTTGATVPGNDLGSGNGDSNNSSGGVGGGSSNTSSKPDMSEKLRKWSFSLTNHDNSSKDDLEEDDEEEDDDDDNEMGRLQALLEARGLPPHLFGSLPQRMQQLLHRNIHHNSNVSKAHNLLEGLESKSETLQLQSLIELCELLVMGNEDTLAGFPIKQTIPALVTLLQMEHNFDMMNHAVRAITYMMEALPRSTPLIAQQATNALISKLIVIQCMDVAEQCLAALEMVSKRHFKVLVQKNFLGNALTYLDFFSIEAQRNALLITANCFQNVRDDEFDMIRDAIPFLTARLLQNSDKKSLDTVCLAFSRLVDSFSSDVHKLDVIAGSGNDAFFSNLQQLLVITPPVLSGVTFTLVIRMLTQLCSRCPKIAVQYMGHNIIETIQSLLFKSDIEGQDFFMPSRDIEILELVQLLGEMTPPLPLEGIFSLNNPSPGIIWQYKDGAGRWFNFSQFDSKIMEAAYQRGDNELSLSSEDGTITVDLHAMQRISEQSSTAIRRHHSSSIVIDKDARSNSDSTAFIQLLPQLLSLIYKSPSCNTQVRQCLLECLTRLVYFIPKDKLSTVLSSLKLQHEIGSQLANMLNCGDKKIRIATFQLIWVLFMEKESNFHGVFYREGVFAAIKGLKEPLSPVPKPEPVPPVVEKKSKSKKSSKRKSNAHHGTEEASPRKSGNGNFFNRFTRQQSNSHSNVGGNHGGSSQSGGGERSKGKTKSNESKNKNNASSNSMSSNPTSGSSSTSIAQGTNSVSSSHCSIPHHTYAVGTCSAGGGGVAGCGVGSPSSGSVGNACNSSVSQDRAVPGCSKALYSMPQIMKIKEADIRLKQHAENFLEKLPDAEQHLKNEWDSKLRCAVELVKDVKTIKEGFESLRWILMQESMSEVPLLTPYEFSNSGVVKALNTVLEEAKELADIPLEQRQRMLLHVFTKCPLEEHKGVELYDKVHVKDDHYPFQLLVQKLNSCISFLEQFEVKMHEVPRHPNSSGLRFFNSQQIKCNLMRAPDCSNVGEWKGGTVKIDSLALVQTIERYLVSKVISRQMLYDSDQDEDDGDAAFFSSLASSGFCSSPQLELMANSQSLSSNMTIYEALKAVYPEDTEILLMTHNIYFRLKKNDPVKTTVRTTLRDPSNDIIELLSKLFSLNRRFFDLYSPQLSQRDLLVGKPIFVNAKLSAKVARQLSDLITVMTGNLPKWISKVSLDSPFLFGFELRILLFYCHAFDKERAVTRVQNAFFGEGDEAFVAHHHHRMMPRLEKRKKKFSRDNLLKEAITYFLNEPPSSKTVLDIEYENEVGTGSGPTAEFYSLVSQHLLTELSGGDEDELLSCGFFPKPIGKNCKGAQLKELKNKYKVLGRLIWRALLDQRLLDVQMSPSFWKFLIYGGENLSLRDIPGPIGQSLRNLVISYHKSNDSLEDLGLYFTMPGYPNIPLKKNGKNVAVTRSNLLEFVKLIVHNFKMSQGMELVKTNLDNGWLKLFLDSEECQTLLCGLDQKSEEKWTISMLEQCCKCDHGYTLQSPPIQFLFQILTQFDFKQRRKFLHFITGSPRLPKNGLKDLKITVVRKGGSKEDGKADEESFPSVMTCVNYLKLPPYSSVSIMRAKLLTALESFDSPFTLS